MDLLKPHRYSGRKYRITTRFRNISIFFFILASVVISAVLFGVLKSITYTVAEDYARLYAANTVGALGTHLNKEIALMAKVAGSHEVAEWFEDEENPEKKAAALEEMLDVIDVLYSDNIYIGIQKTLNEMTVEKGYTVDDIPPYATLDPDYYDDSWYFECIESRNDYVLNVDIDKILGRKRVWLNYKVTRDGDPLGVICSGLEIAQVVEELFSEFDDARVRGLVIDASGAIQMDSLHLGDDDFIHYAVDGESEEYSYIDDIFSDPAVLDVVNTHLSGIDGYFSQTEEPGLTQLTSGDYDFMTVAAIAETDWSVIMLYNSSSLFDSMEFMPIFIIVPLLFIAFALSISAMCYRMIFRPFELLTGSLTQVKDDSDGRIYGLDRRDEFGDLANTIQEMKERVKAEHKVRSLAAIVAIADAGIIIKDKGGVVLEWNIGAKNILGYCPEDIVGKTTHYYAPEESHSGIDNIEARLQKGEHIAHVDVIRKHKDGRLIDCSASYTPIFDGKGSFDGSVAIFHDVTDKKLAEKNALNLAAIVTAADAGIVIKDTDCNILEWNIGAENILGYKPEEIIGKNTKYYVPEETHGEIDEIKERLLKGEHTSHVEVVRVHKDGRRIDCAASYTPVFDMDGNYIGSVAVFHDISEKKQIELKLKEALLAAEETSKAKTSFLANMSHEIRTPMNGIIGFAELALAEEEITGSVRGYLTKIKTSADNLLNIINDILDVSKIEAGAMEIENVPFDLHEVFRDCETISNIKAVEKGIALHFYAEPFIGKSLVGDPTKLRQVLLNLLSNAIKFTNYGMVKLTATIVAEKNDAAEILFEVKDSGIGMTPEQMRSIFDPFIQADSSTTRKYGGTGLGLAITKSFVELMGGKLNLESTLGLGTKFSFSLSFSTVSVPDMRPQKKDDFCFAQKLMFAGEVLVCEDNPINQEVIQKHLKRVGLACVIAANGKQGVEAANERIQKGKPFDLILMDIHMPVMDGLEATQILLKTGNLTPIVALTANAMITDKEKYLEHGMSDYLSKPFTTQELCSCLARHLTQINSVPSSDSADEITKPAQTADKQTHLINEAAGLKNATGDEQFYRHLRKYFYKDNINVMQELSRLLRENDLKTAHRVVHTLKSSAGMIGAERLAQVAGSVEAMLNNGGNNCPPELMESLKSSVTEILSILKPLSYESEVVPVQAAGSLKTDTASELIEKLTPLLKSGNPESAEYAGEIRAVLSPLGEICETLAAQIEDYDFDAAYETICLIKAQ